MAITRGQMQRQLRRGGGITSIAPREQFGLGSKLKKFVRKAIPNEIADIAVKAAPFVAPFNPALAGAMAGIGSFDQTGSLSGALKSGALTYGGGQLARYVGGAGFQGNPFTSGGAFTPTGFTAGFSSPLGTDTGIGKILSDRAAAKGQALRLEGVQGIGSEGLTGSDVGGNITLAESAGGTSASPTILAEQMSEASLTPRTVTTATKQTTPSITKLIKEGNYIDAAVEAGKKGTKAIFLDKDGNLDKTALLAAGSFGLSYVDAKKLADDAGVDIGTETEYDEATKAEKKEEYASYLTNFFGGRKDGGRIGFKDGYSPGIVKKALKKYNSVYGIDVSGEEILVKDLYSGGFDEFLEIFARDNRAQGGRIGYMFGDKVEDKEGIMSMSEDEEDENMKMAYFPGDVFSKAEIARLFRDRSLTTNQDRKDLYKILMNPGMYPEAEDMLKRLLRGKQDGGRIGFNSGSRDLKDYKFMELFDEESYNKKLKEKEDLINELMDKGYRFDDIMQLVSPRTERLMDDGTYKQYGDAPSISLGKIGFNMGGEVPVRKNKAGIEELDYRQTGGFVPVGVKEKADDVPAMLSKNEFVLTADAVRGIGGGDVEKGAEKLYGVMKQAEKVGRA
jgi:hypothetical protein